MAEWTRELPTTPGVFDHRNLENAGGRVPIRERVMWVGFVNWTEDPKQGHGTAPTEYMPPKLRAVRIEHPMTADSLAVQEWGGEWRRIDRVPVDRKVCASPCMEGKRTSDGRWTGPCSCYPTAGVGLVDSKTPVHHAPETP
jgi:hypothetical protein